MTPAAGKQIPEIHLKANHAFLDDPFWPSLIADK
jgi:hypothetical protein